MKIIYSLLLVLLLGKGLAQPFHFEMPAIPVIRQSAHDNIDKSQQQILALNCKRDSVFIASNNLDVNLYITAQLKNKVDYLQYYVETAIEGNDRYRWLRGINDMLQGFIKSYRDKKIEGIYLSDLINAYYNANNQSINSASD